jgi:hypothetical protein
MLRAYEAFLIRKGTARTQNVFLFEVGFGSPEAPPKTLHSSA